MQNKIGFIGAGNMATALVRGLLSSGEFRPEAIMASDVDSEQLARIASDHKISTSKDNREVCAFANTLVLAVKPQGVDPVLAELQECFDTNKLLISLIAGTTTSQIEGALPSGARVVRAMPNTPALVLAGATGLAPGALATDADLAEAARLFSKVGKTVTLAEAQIDAVTGLSGSGPAYVMLAIEALADGGVRVGLPREIALLLASQTVYGSAKLLMESGDHPGAIKDRVTSPGGTTIAGVHALEAGGLRRTLIDAVVAATERARQLGKRS